MSRTKIALLVIIAVAFFVRIAGVAYGLPMQLVSDESPFVFGALKMMELRTLIPALHTMEFVRNLYFPPYLSYIFLILFIPVLGIRYLLFHGTLQQFIAATMLDPSLLFLAGRLVSVLLGTATVWLVYKTAKRIFAREAPALLSAAFLALSFLHVNFSHWARHWVPATFFFALVMYVLSREDMKVRKRYIVASLIAGIGVGINYQAGLSALFIALWFVFYPHTYSGAQDANKNSTIGVGGYDRLPLRERLKERWVYGCIVLFIGLVALAYALYPQGLVVHQENVTAGGKSVVGFIAGYGFYAAKLLETEPAFFVFIITGFIALFFRARRYFWTSSLFAFAYIAIFYLFFFHMDRYILMLYPLFAIAAGYGLWVIASHMSQVTCYMLLFIAFGVSALGVVRLDALLIKNDTRVQAEDWISANVTADAKVVALARLMRIPTTAEAVQEQRRLDPSSLRSADVALETLPRTLLPSPSYHALNLFAVNPVFLTGKFLDYMRAQRYAYLAYSPEFVAGYDIAAPLATLGETVAAFPGFTNNEDDITNGFGGGLRNMFALESNGPTILIKKLDSRF